jgi:hypothetical protein
MDVTIEQLKSEGFLSMVGEHGHVKQYVYQLGATRYNVYENAANPAENSITVVGVRSK